MNTETPTELFRFATQLTTNYGSDLIESRVKTLIARLGLEKCKDTIVGGFYLKGLSGGERKRTSIGYELVTNPRVLLLDEPTSGLDSSTALSIGKLLKREAKRGVAVLCTIHSPSSELIMTFDKCIVLSSGYTIYNGPVVEVANFFKNSIDLIIPPYTNYADYLILCATDPKLVNCTKSLVQLAEESSKYYKDLYNQS